ncbi:MAG: type II/IV secretion system protein [Phycisphaerales bacterium]|nr:type II/IV secretion system protein [Phycisphaerales bacterium]
MPKFDIDKLLAELGPSSQPPSAPPAAPAEPPAEDRPHVIEQSAGPIGAILSASRSQHLHDSKPPLFRPNDTTGLTDPDFNPAPADASSAGPAPGPAGPAPESDGAPLPPMKGGPKRPAPTPFTPAPLFRAPKAPPAAEGVASDAARAAAALGRVVEREAEPVDADAPRNSSITEIYQPGAEESVGGTHGDLKAALLAEGIITKKIATTIDNILKSSPGARLLDLLHDQGVDEEAVLKAAARVHGCGFERVSVANNADGTIVGFDAELVQRLGLEFCKQAMVLPLRNEAGRLIVGTSRPDDVFVIDDIRMRLAVKSVRLSAVPSSDIKAALALLDDGAGDTANVEAILGDIDEDDVTVEKKDVKEVDLEKEAAESPVIRYVNYIIQMAVKEGASDIHIEPGEKALKVRFRIDGLLFEMMQPPFKMAAAIISRLKIMGNLDIAERRIPQDGRIRCNVQGRKLDLRMSTIPTANGEKVVLRILDQRSISVGLDDLGFDANTLEVWKHQIDQPHGVILVTGPTGSGKTTTLYASLRQMDKVSQNISTVEDPIEYHLDGVTQTQTHERIGMTFAKALKALLRQDPDIIMVGEIRDLETAHTAVQAALTGHLVLSTLHTNDAPSAVTRLVNIGIEPFLLGAAVNAVLAQRLVRRVCAGCRAPADLSDEHREFLQMQGIPLDSIFKGAGCKKCRDTGYTGRLGIYELLVMDDHLRDIVARNPNVTEFRRLCTERGMVTLRQDGIAKIQQGLTTTEEVLRVTESTI